jgi:hypothetical protein
MQNAGWMGILSYLQKIAWQLLDAYWVSQDNFYTKYFLTCALHEITPWKQGIPKLNDPR